MTVNMRKPLVFKISKGRKSEITMAHENEAERYLVDSTY